MVDRLAAIERVMALRQDVERGHIRGHRLRYRVLAPDPRGREHKFGLITFVFNPYSDTISAYRSVFRQPMAPGMLTLSTEDGSPTFFQSTDMAGMGGSIADSYIFHSWAGGGKFLYPHAAEPGQPAGEGHASRRAYAGVHRRAAQGERVQGRDHRPDHRDDLPVRDGAAPGTGIRSFGRSPRPSPAWTSGRPRRGRWNTRRGRSGAAAGTSTTARTISRSIVAI